MLGAGQTGWKIVGNVAVRDAGLGDGGVVGGVGLVGGGVVGCVGRIDGGVVG